MAVFGGPAGALAPNEIERRVDELLSRMTLEEKVGQLNLVSNDPTFVMEEIRAGRVGAGINFNNAQDIAAAQASARQSRLGIPLIFGLDILHGFRTMFPMPLAEAATFNPALARKAAEWSAREASYVGIQWTYAPMADLSRDPRWGRIIEGSGEDPFLGRIFAAARVEGLHAGGSPPGSSILRATGPRPVGATTIQPRSRRPSFAIWSCRPSGLRSRPAARP